MRCEVSDLLLNIVGDELSKQRETETSTLHPEWRAPFTSLTGRLQVFLVPNSSKMDEDTNSDEGWNSTDEKLTPAWERRKTDGLEEERENGSWRDGSLGTALALQTQRSKFNSQKLCLKKKKKKPGMLVCAGNASMEEVETGESLKLMD